MTDEQLGVEPIPASALLRTALGMLEGRKAFEGPLEPSLLDLAANLCDSLPSHFLPDTYLDQSLLGRESPRAALVFDATECAYLMHFGGSSLAPCTSGLGIVGNAIPERYNHVCGLVADISGTRAFDLEDTSFDARNLMDYPCLARLSAGGDGDVPGPRVADLIAAAAQLPARALVRESDGQVALTLQLKRSTAQARFSRASYRSAVLELLHDCGCANDVLSQLDRLSFAFGLPYRLPDDAPAQWFVFVDIAYVTLVWTHGQLTDCRLGVVITDKLVDKAEMAFKPTITYQWHITDNCDQRCKHCYLFAEDAQAHCVSTSWEQLIHTLDEIEESATLCHAQPCLAITGGDPLLHPRFWDFAGELQRRGIRWSAMGNPFHLDAGACRRLRQLGCYQYQMSLDGLEAFHDRLRKPGSYRATLAALPLLTDAGIQTQLMATASRQNLDDILACMDIAVQHGASSFAFARYCATSPQKAAELYPSPAEYRAFMLAYYRKKQAYEQAGCATRFKTKDHLFTLLRWELGEFVIPAYSLADRNRVCGGCHLGGKSTIASNGDLLACRRMDSVVGNIATDHLYDADTGEAMRAYAAVGEIEKCRDCELLNWCRGCRAVGYNATGNLQAADPMCWHQVQA